MADSENLERLARQLMERLHAAERELRLAKKKLRDKSAALEAARARVKEIEKSPWWKITRPFRKRPKKDAPKAIASPAEIGPLGFPQHAEVEVSVVIPVHNQIAFTHQCLHSLWEHRGSQRMEIIVVDDGSSDATTELPQKAKGIVYLRNEQNVGFVGSCNRGADAARGEFLVFLNNDTTVTAGWLDALRRVFALFPDAGLVGAKLVYPDGRLQEAGGAIRSDGAAANVGKGGDPDDPRYHFVREVDYCSAACVMIPRALFRELGGFDTRYAPAYYEDVDLAFKVKQSGRRVLYQPFCKVIHHEGATAGTNVDTGAKTHQDTNRVIFFEKWIQRLASQSSCGNASRILVIDDHMPTPDRHAAGLRMFHLLNILHEQGHAVTFIPGDGKKLPGYTEALQERGIEVLYEPHFSLIEDVLEKRGAEWSVVILSRLKITRKYLEPVRQYALRAKVIFDTVDLGFLRTAREATVGGDPAMQAEAEVMKAEELFAMESADETWVVSSAEKELLAREKPRVRVEVLPTLVEMHGCAKPFAARRDLLFIGGFRHRPNGDAVRWFVADIFPLVRAQLPGVKFYIIGADAPHEIVALASDDIIVTGHQPDISGYFENIKLTVAPLRFGAGVKGKINLSMSYGVPVVATSLAAEGMDLIAGEDLLVEDDPERFAAAMVTLHSSESLWQSLSTRGLEATRKNFSIENVRKKLAGLIPLPPHGRRV